MGKDINQLFHGIPPCDEDDDELCESSSLSSDDGEEDSFLPGFREGAISSSNSPPPSAKTASLPPHGDANGPLYDLSSLMAQLPIKRGLSKYYVGKSQSFTSLSDVRCLEDLPKKQTPYRRKMKSSKSHGGGLDGSPRSNHPPGTSSKAMPKKASGGSCASSMARSGGKPPSINSCTKEFLSLHGK